MPVLARWITRSRDWHKGPANPVKSLSVQAVESAPTALRSSFETLVAHLFACLFVAENSGSSRSPKTLMLQAAVLLGLPPMLMTLALIPAYNGMMPFLTLRSFWGQVQDHVVFVTYSGTVVGVAALLKWEGFFPTLLDVRILGLLPLSKTKFFAAKVLAAGIFLGAFLTGSNLAAAIVFPGIAGAPSVPRHIAAHALSVGLAGCFTGASCLALLSAVVLLPGRLARHIGSIVQGLLLTALLLMLFLSPLAGLLPEALLASHSKLIFSLPPFWFAGLYEVLLRGTIVSAAFVPLARLAVIGTGISVVALAMLYPLAYRRRSAEMLEGETPTHVSGDFAARATLARIVAQEPLAAASFHLLRETIFRVPRLRLGVLLATCAGMAVAIFVVAAPTPLATPPYLIVRDLHPVSILTVVLLFIIGSIYLAVGNALEPRARWIFTTTIGTFHPQIGVGLRRWVMLVLSGFAMAGLGLIAALTAVSTRWEWLRGGVMLFALCALLTEVLFRAFREIPFTANRLRQDHLVSTMVTVAVGLPCFLWCVKQVEPSVMDSWMVLVAFVVLIGVLIYGLQRYVTQTPDDIREDEDEDPFQRLRL